MALCDEVFSAFPIIAQIVHGVLSKEYSTIFMMHSPDGFGFDDDVWGLRGRSDGLSWISYVGGGDQKWANCEKLPTSGRKEILKK